MQITVVIPTYNEVQNLPHLVNELLNLPFAEMRILIVDDSSPDGTAKVAEHLQTTYPGMITVLHRPRKLGIGSAYIQGFRLALEAGAETVCQMDADLSHSPSKILELAEALKRCDVAIGSRYIPGGSLDRQWSLWRKGLSVFGNLYARLILGTPIRDMTSGFRLWRRSTLMAMPLERVRSNGYAFQVEMAYIAYLLGFSFKEIPIYFKERERGASKMSFQIQVEAALRVWKLLWEYRDLRL